MGKDSAARIELGRSIHQMEQLMKKSVKVIFFASLGYTYICNGCMPVRAVGKPN